MTRISILGDGGWGTALGLMLFNKGHSVRIWSPFPEAVERVLRERENKPFLPGIPIPEGVQWTSERSEAVSGAELVIFAVPSKFFRAVLESFAGFIPGSCAVLSVSKGLDSASRRRLSEVACGIFSRPDVAVLSGPSHAEEVVRGKPTAVVIACSDIERALSLQKIMASSRFRIYTSSDVIGVELGGALKNIIALASGASDGLGFGDNTRAALMTRGLAEITRLGCALGARAETFAGLSGMGDLVVTCSSRLSRNRLVGERLGRGEKLDAILGSMKQAAEGVTSSPTALALARDSGVRSPIIREVHAVLHEGRGPERAVEALMSRGFRPETD